VVLYEPLALWAFAFYTALTAAGTPAAPGAAEIPPHIAWLSLAGYGVGSAIDLVSRGRAYAAMPPDRRKSRYREWKERLLWGAVGLMAGVLMSIGVNGEWLAGTPHWHPLSNMVLVGIVALPGIDFFRALIRALSGQSDVFAGLVINFLRARSDARGGGTAASGGEDV